MTVFRDLEIHHLMVLTRAVRKILHGGGGECVEQWLDVRLHWVQGQEKLAKYQVRKT